MRVASRLGLLVGLTAVLSSATGACGGGGSAGVAHVSQATTTTVAQAAPAGSSLSQEALAYSQCMRKHGEPDFPDPDSAGSFPVSGLAKLDRSSPQFQAAAQACLALRPRPSGQEVAQAQAQLLKFSACMRTHGLSTFPDFTLGSGGAAKVARQYLRTIDPNSSQFQSALQSCRSLLPPTIAAAVGER